ncbi:hypothetical protein PFISCL1PPCAC_3425, partial [Pristionchus fissidentatus]
FGLFDQVYKLIERLQTLAGEGGQLDLSSATSEEASVKPLEGTLSDRIAELITKQARLALDRQLADDRCCDAFEQHGVQSDM